MTTPHTLQQEDLGQFVGTGQWYKHPLTPILYTDGVKHVANAGGAHWLINEIAFAQLDMKNRAVIKESFQVWTLQVHTNQSATLTCANRDGTPLWSKPIAYTGFPLETITFYLTDTIIMLPSEY
ncbi:MAG: hypothetical protein MI924_15910 [Chloroflexales bacterium]|nr:hypothetical protein [Chloroflexales bacterium]